MSESATYINRTPESALDVLRKAAWLGYSREGERTEVRLRDLGGKALLLGQRAAELASLMAYALVEAGEKVTILDLDGSLGRTVSGYFRTLDYRSFLYDAFRIEDQDARHGQFVAAAYAMALDLTYEEEAILNSALQIIVAQDNMVSPPVLFDALGKVEGFRGFYVDKMKGRMGSLKLMDATHVEGFAGLLAGGVLVDFSQAPYPQSADLAVALFIAKLLAQVETSEQRPDLILVTAAHRLFRSITRMLHGNRLMTYILEAPEPFVLTSGQPALLSGDLTASVPLKLYSSDAWNARKDKREPSALPSSFVIQEQRMGAAREFVPRHVPLKTLEPQVPTFSSELNRELALLILEEIDRFKTATRESLLSYISVGHLRLDVEGELDKLDSGGYLMQEMKQEGSGPPIFSYVLTDAGRQLLRELRR